MVVYHDQVTRQRPDEVPGPYNTPVLDWSSPETRTYPAEIQPLASQEFVSDEQRVEGRWWVYLPPVADVLPTDRIVHHGLVYEVDGEPEIWRAHGRVHHVRVRVSKWRGA